MIAFIEGELVSKGADRAVISVGGVGYELIVPASVVASLPGSGARARLHTRLVVREDSMTLFGFADTDQRLLFDRLNGVSGVGPKVAISFLSALRPDDIRRAIAAGDPDALTVVPGVGKKVAQRVVLDLRDELGAEAAVVGEGPLADVREALLALGLTPAEATQALARLDVAGKEVDELLREALQDVGR